MLPRLPRFSLRLKFMAGTALSLLLISAFILTYFPHQQNQQAKKALASQAHNIAEMVALGVGMGLASSDYVAVKAAMDWAKEDSSLAYIVVLDSDGEQFAAFNPDSATLDTKHVLPIGGTYERGDKLIATVPIRYQGNDHGQLILGYSLATMIENVNRSRTTTIYFSLAMLLTGLLISFWYSTMLTKPILQIRDAAHEIAMGNDDIDLSMASRDELGDLTRAFSILIDRTRALTRAAQAIGEGNYDVPIQVRSEKDTLGNTLVVMKQNLVAISAVNERQTWLKTGQADLNDKMRGEQDVVSLAQNIISELCSHLDVQIGALYIADDNGALKLLGSYAYEKRKSLSGEFKVGEGLVGQSALERKRILFSEVPEDYVRISSGLGNTVPRNLVVTPLLHDGSAKGVIELGSTAEFTEAQLDFLDQVSESIAVAFHSAQSRERLKELLRQTQEQAEEMQAQQEELRQTNEELEGQTKALQDSEGRLQAQQEELRQMNDELQDTNQQLEEKAAELERQQKDIQQKNTELAEAQKEIEQKAVDLEASSKYKSEFLANMSHELRTPLNSLLILAKLLSENKDGNLTEKQVEFANTIHSAGSDLLDLINEVLDISKVEAGKLRLHIEEASIEDMCASLTRNFSHLAEQKGLKLEVTVAGDLPATIRTDRQRVDQIIKNLLSNAFKFTERGSVSVDFSRPASHVNLSSSGLKHPKAIAIAVADTGKGIAEDKQKLIFEAFQQEDGTTSRKFGGTGLGLSISRSFARLLGGEIHLRSTEGEGTTFTLYLPEVAPEGKADEKTAPRPASPVRKPARSRAVARKTEAKPTQTLKDDRDSTSPDDKSILIVEDDPRFARILRDFSREKGFKTLVAPDGELGLELADIYRPSGVILDIGLPTIDGWGVMERLKGEAATRHIPVYFMSAFDSAMEAMRKGAIGYLTKPVSMDQLEEAFDRIGQTLKKNVKSLLIVEDDENQRKSILELIGNGGVRSTAVSTGQEAYDLLKSNSFDCMILDLGLEDISGFELLERIKSDDNMCRLPVIVYTGKDLTKDEDAQLAKYAQSIIIKGVKSPERLLEETTLYLHRQQEDPPRRDSRSAGGKDGILKGKRILLADDDMRNVFALSAVLEEKGISVQIARDGKEAVAALHEDGKVDLVLMDIMMPEMDGYDAIKEIRNDKRFSDLPIIALTAKAMKGDRDKCMDAGASDYLTKPVNTEKLFSLMRVWLHA